MTLNEGSPRPADRLALTFALIAATHHVALRDVAESVEYLAYHEGSRDTAIVAAIWTVGRGLDQDPNEAAFNAIRQAVEDLVACPTHADNPSHVGRSFEVIACPRVAHLTQVLDRLAVS